MWECLEFDFTNDKTSKKNTLEMKLYKNSIKISEQNSFKNENFMKLQYLTLKLY